MINPVSNRPSYAGYVPSKPSVEPAGDRAAFEGVAEGTAAGTRSTGSVDAAASAPGIQLSRAYELASKRPVSRASVPQDLLWALTGPGRP